MADSLRIRKPEAGCGNLMAGIVLAFPLLFLVALALQRDARLHHPDPRINFLVHAFLIAWPCLVALWFFRDAPQYYADDETTLTQSGFWNSLRFLWWAMLPLLIPLVLVLIIFGREAMRWAQNGLPDWSTSGASALGIVFVAGAYLLFYGTLLRDRTSVRVSDRGMRTGNLHFLEWENIARIVRQGSRCRVYHKVQPRLPFSGFTLTDTEATALLNEHLTRHEIAVAERHDPFLSRVQSVILLASLLLLLAGVGLYYATSLDRRWVLVLSAVVAVVITVLLERVRGISRITAQKPVMDE